MGSFSKNRCRKHIASVEEQINLKIRCRNRKVHQRFWKKRDRIAPNNPGELERKEAIGIVS